MTMQFTNFLPFIFCALIFVLIALWTYFLCFSRTARMRKHFAKCATLIKEADRYRNIYDGLIDPANQEENNLIDLSRYDFEVFIRDYISTYPKAAEYAKSKFSEFLYSNDLKLYFNENAKNAYDLIPSPTAAGFDFVVKNKPQKEFYYDRVGVSKQMKTKTKPYVITWEIPQNLK